MLWKHLMSFNTKVCFPRNALSSAEATRCMMIYASSNLYSTEDITCMYTILISDAWDEVMGRNS